MKSLPSRERGLKLLYVTTLWFVLQSLPSRERGLKYKTSVALSVKKAVAPLAGAWVEIGCTQHSQSHSTYRRSPRGSVG